MNLVSVYTSTGEKMFAHQEVMTKLRNGQGQPVVTHIMLTDVCNHSCAFCSVQARVGDSLAFGDVQSYLDILQRYGLKSVILSGGGNPILYRCKNTGFTFNDMVQEIHARGLQIGLITNGMPLKQYSWSWDGQWREMDDQYLNPALLSDISLRDVKWRKSWKTVWPETLDRLTWIRISMSGLDHAEHEVYVPDIDPSKTTLGFSYVGHDLYVEPADPHHGKVSTRLDLLSGNKDRAPDWPFESRLAELQEQIGLYVQRYKPRYVRLLPNCLEPELIPRRCQQLQHMAACINYTVEEEVVFVQQKPPKAPHVCLLGAIHPVLATDGLVYPCDSVTLAVAEVGYRQGKPDHNFRSPWAICHWSEIARLYDNKLPHSLISDPGEMCKGCVFEPQNRILEGVRDGTIDPVPPSELPTHANFV